MNIRASKRLRLMEKQIWSELSMNKILADVLEKIGDEY
jgi:hypothetical protein